MIPRIEEMLNDYFGWGVLLLLVAAISVPGSTDTSMTPRVRNQPAQDEIWQVTVYSALATA